MRRATRFFALLAVPLLVALLVVIAINAFDEPLNDQAAALGEPQAASVPQAQNGYLAVIAMGAGDGADGAAYAAAWLAEARAAALEQRAEKPIAVTRAARKPLCDAVQTSCLAAVQVDGDAINADLGAYTEDLARYETLIGHTAYEEILDYRFSLESQFPRYVSMGAAQRAWIVRAARAAQAGNIDDALSAIERDLAFYRVMLSGSRTLIGRMVAAAHYTRDLAFVADLMQTSLVDLKPHAPRLSAMLKPIAPNALNMDALMDTEFGGMKQALNPLSLANNARQGAFYEALGLRLLYKPNASVNAAHAYYGQQRALLRMPPAALARSQALEAAPGSDLKLWDYIDNPIGKALTRVSMPSFVSYAQRLHDLDAMNRLLGLGAEIIAADVDEEGIAAFVAQSDARFFDPYSGKPMAWDATARQLSFKVSHVIATRKLFNVDNGRLFLRM